MLGSSCQAQLKEALLPLCHQPASLPSTHVCEARQVQEGKFVENWNPNAFQIGVDFALLAVRAELHGCLLVWVRAGRGHGYSVMDAAFESVAESPARILGRGGLRSLHDWQLLLGLPGAGLILKPLSPPGSSFHVIDVQAAGSRCLRLHSLGSENLLLLFFF